LVQTAQRLVVMGERDVDGYPSARLTSALLPDCQADAGIRTPDPHFTKVVLYQLSYVGTDDVKPAAQGS
jgi:hypothetical protein